MVDVQALLLLCKKFIDEHDIGCAETIYQTDRVIEDASEFIEAICDIVGYPISPPGETGFEPAILFAEPTQEPILDRS
jgi:hypothetical protein